MSDCMWCEDGWPMAGAEAPGEHQIEAEGQYATVPCRRPEEYAKFLALKEKEKSRADIWAAVCLEVQGYEARNSRYVELLREGDLLI